MTPPLIKTHIDLSMITESFDAVLLRLFELQEPVNFVAHELGLICDLEFDFRRLHKLIIHHDAEGCVHTCSSVPSGLTKGEKKWYQSASTEHCETINSKKATKGISKCKIVKR